MMVLRDEATYESLLKAMATLSGLFSESDVPYIDSRFVERLFVVTSGATDLGRADKSFDAQLPGGVGVGIKTFTAPTGNHKTEKVAEFTALAREGRFRVSDKKVLVRRVAEARNTRVLSNAHELGIDIDKSIYHCLIRFRGAATVHEEPYRLINIDNLAPLNKAGLPADDWTFADGKIYFTDGLSNYSFSVAKNVLMKRFNFKRDQNVIQLKVHPNPLALLEELVGRRPSSSSLTSVFSLGIDDSEKRGTPGVDYVVLPLYSTRNGEVPERSGINQWNAGGRSRKFGEAYVPVPSLIHQYFPEFFPSRDVHFTLRFPNGFTTQQAKICQEGGKALMTEKNVELGRWLLSVIDPDIEAEDFEISPRSSHRPYSRKNLIAIGSDSVIVNRDSSRSPVEYSIEFAPLGAYGEFSAGL